VKKIISELHNLEIIKIYEEIEKDLWNVSGSHKSSWITQF